MVEEEPNLVQALVGHGLAQRGGIVGVEQQEAPATGTYEFASSSPVGPAELIPAVDDVVLLAAGQREGG